MAILRPFERADLDNAFELDQVCFPQGIAYSRAELRYFLQRRSAFAIVAENAGRMAGFLIAEHKAQRKGAAGPTAHIVTIDVDPTQRRNGIGQLLMDAAEKHYAGLGCVSLSLEVAVDNVGALMFYTRRSFQTSAILPGYYHDALDAFTMQKTLIAETHH